MTQNSMLPITPAGECSGKPPVRAKLRRLGVEHGKIYPPDGESKKW